MSSSAGSFSIATTTTLTRREPGDLDEDRGRALGEDLPARDAVRERELELAVLLVVRDGARAPADRGDRDEHEADEAEERRLRVPGPEPIWS